MIRIPATLALLAALTLAGCRYGFDSRPKLAFRDIVVEPVRNESFAPQIQAITHARLVDALSQEKALHVTDTSGAHLAVTITDFRRDIGAVDPSDTVRASSYDLLLVAKATLTLADGTALFHDREFRAHLPAYVKGGYVAVEAQTMPALAGDLAKQIRDAVVGVW